MNKINIVNLCIAIGWICFVAGSITSKIGEMTGDPILITWFTALKFVFIVTIFPILIGYWIKK